MRLWRAYMLATPTIAIAALVLALSARCASSPPSHLVGFSGQVIDLTQLYTKAQFPGIHSVKEYGARGDGVADDTSALQAAFTAGGVIRVPPGTYLMSSSVNLTSNTTITCERGAIFKKTFASPPGISASWFHQADYTQPTGKIHDLTIEGPCTFLGADTTKTGNVFGLYGDRITLRDFTIDTYNAGRAIFCAGDNWLIDHLRIINPANAAGVGGIRYVGGDSFVARNNYVVSGDDALQFVPIPPSGGNTQLTNMNITRGLYQGNTGQSTAGRFIAVLLAETVTHTGLMTDSISHVTFRDNHGSGANRVVVIENADSSGSIDNVLIDDASLTVTGTPVPSDEFFVGVDATSTGTMSDITLSGVSVASPGKTTMRIFGATTQVSRILLDRVNLAGPSTTATSTLLVDGGTDITVRDSHFTGCSGGGANVVSVGTFGTTNVDHFVMSRGRVDEIYNGGASFFGGVRLAHTTNPSVEDVAFVEHAGQDTAFSTSLSTDAAKAMVFNLDVVGMVQSNSLSDGAIGTTRLVTDGYNNTLNGTVKFNNSIVGRNAPTLAAASTLALSGGGNIFLVSSTGIPIDTIPANNGQRITLSATGAVTFNSLAHGGNLDLAGNADFVTTNNGSIDLWSDGSRWHESARRTP